MRNERTVEITVKPIFSDKGNLDDILIKLIRKKSGENIKKPIDSVPLIGYNIGAVIPDVHAERGIYA